MKKRIVISSLLILALILAVSGICALFYIKDAQTVLAIKTRKYISAALHTRRFPHPPDPYANLNITKETRYVNNRPAASVELQKEKDNKLVLETPQSLRLFDYAAGYALDLPLGTSFDFSKSPHYTEISGDGFSGVISKEWSVDADVSAYVENYFNRFILNADYQQHNGIQLAASEKTADYERITLALSPEYPYDRYTYLILKTDSRFFFRVMLRHHADVPMTDTIQSILDSFQYFKPTGTAAYDLDLYPVLPAAWSAETAALYDRFAAPDGFLWGIFAQDVKERGIDQIIPDMEKSLDYRFDIILTYTSLAEGFPTDFMRRCYDENRVVELTYQLTDNNNENLFAQSPLLNMHQGIDYPQIRAFAKDAAAFGRPFLFRLNNEMNSDWVSYGGVNNLQDPSIFAENWRTIYRIFEEEGVNNAIWIFNPNDRDCPPNGWNSYLAYYPGNEYVHMFGVTGYNNGSYYKEVFNESWREFDTIYDVITDRCGGLFDRFPWIITEFASGSVGGNKEKWINNMFKSLDRYPQIKAAVWFSFADFDFRPGYEGTVSRSYWLDETPQTLESFKRGLKR